MMTTSLSYQQELNASELPEALSNSQGTLRVSTIEHALTLDSQRLAGIRRSFTTRRVELPAEVRVSTDAIPRAGDLVLARVVGIGQHGRIELPSGRRSFLHIGDEIIVTYGNRYAPDQFEAEIPRDLDECHLVAAGGIAARMISKHPRVKTATRIQPVGLLLDQQDRPINLDRWKLANQSLCRSIPPVIAVAGTSMNAGKTTTASRLIRGLYRSGKRVGAAKLTGTGAGGDIWNMKDAGAIDVVDFTDAGFPSTYKLPREALEAIFLDLLSHLASLEVDVIVLEIADGLLQRETATLLTMDSFVSHCSQVLFAASDSMGAVAGANWLTNRRLHVSAISGALTASPLAIRETAISSGLPVYTKQELSDPMIADHLFRLAG